MRTIIQLAAIAALAAAGCGDDSAVDDSADADSADSDADAGDADAGDADTGDADGTTPSCGELSAVVRDMLADHPDFEDTIAGDRGLVRTALGSDGKPVYAHAGRSPGGTVAGPASFDQWYRDVVGVNLRFDVPLPLTEGPPGTYTFEDNEFFPLDGQGFPNTEVQGHNFHFTTEIHSTFQYRGGEVFTFTGDDDVFIFVNGTLALDLGGVHAVEEATIDFDAQASTLGITVGQAYAIDMFHAERHTSQSNFRVTTTIECFVVP